MNDARREKGKATRQLILQRATELFLHEGYSTTSIDRVAEVAGVSKPTVYSHFQSKTGLFKAAVEASAEERAGKLGALLKATDDPESDLRRFGEKFLSVVLSAEADSWDRIAAAEARSHPEVGRIFFEAGPKRVNNAVANYIKQQTAAGLMFAPSPSEAAELLMGMLLGVDLLRTRIGAPAPSSTKIRRKCKTAVRVFLAAYGNKNDSNEE